MRTIAYRLIIFLAGLGCSPGVTAQTESYPFNFDYLNKSNGLPHNYCHTALRDHRGFMWFGTQDGLARYDGVAFKVYACRGDSTGPSAPTVLDIDEDRSGKLWIATIGGGLNRFDPVTETFSWYRHDPLDPTSLPGNDLTNLLIDDDGYIWIGGYASGFSRFDPRTGQCLNFDLGEHLGIEEDRYRRNSVLDISADIDDPGVLWLAANTGIFQFDKRSTRLRFFPTTVPCRDVQGDAPGLVWVATEGGGIARFDKKTNGWSYYTSAPEAWRLGNRSANQIVDISRKSANEFWVASLDSGFGIFDMQTGRYTFFNSQAKLLAGQAGQSVNGLYRDPSGLLWIFNDKNGISLLDPASNVLGYTSLPLNACRNSRQNEPQDFAWNAARHELYVVTRDCEGLYVYTPVPRVPPVELSGQSPYRLLKAVRPDGGRSAALQCILAGREGRYWVGSREADAHSLYEFDPITRRLTPFRHRLLSRTPLQQYPVNALVTDAAGRLWAGSTRGGLFCVDFQKDTIRQYVSGTGFDGSNVQISGLACDRKGRIWIATEEAGVFRFDPADGNFTPFAYRPGVVGGLAENRVPGIAADRAGNVWVGTDNRGFQQIPEDARPTDTFPVFTVKDGLAFNKIHRLAIAPDGMLWITTEKGVSAFRPGTRTFETYDEVDGLADTYLSNQGLYCGPDGEVFIGQRRGFYAFRPKEVFQNKTPPVPAFTGFQLFGRPWFAGKDLNALSELQLEHNQNFFTIQFAALSLSQSNRNQYEHQLVGIDPGWENTGNRSEVSYTQVPPGWYLFQVRARNSSGVASKEELKLWIVIRPAFYQTWWFRLSVIAILIIGIAVWIRQRLSRILRQSAARNELDRLRAQKAELENKALRAQMNPHFIFNALNTIEALVVEENPDAASALLQKFSKLVRLVLENSRQPRVQLARELDALELYIQLEMIRLDGRLRYQITVDPRLEKQSCLVPPMILQPYVENAILHGLRHLTDREGLLTVEIEYREAGSDGGPAGLMCRIADNGIGRAAAERINQRTRIGAAKQSLGTAITAERIALLNESGGSDFGVDISDAAAGTVVTVFLPVEMV